MVNIAIAEDIQGLAQALKEKVELNDEFVVRGLAPNGKELLQLLAEDSHIDLVLMDINMPEMDGIEATQALKQAYPHIKVVMSTVFDQEDYILKAIMAGANGYLLKDEKPLKLHLSIQEVLEGGAPMSSAIAQRALKLIRYGVESEEVNENYSLSKRETEVLEQLATGLNYQEISNNLFISPATVRKHIENIYQKLQVHNKVEAIQLALKNRLIWLSACLRGYYCLIFCLFTN